jgi:anti-anti-sigma regulatory factor
MPSTTTRPALRLDRPTYQWETARPGSPTTLRLFGVLGARDLDRVADALRERCRSPRDLACLDFEEVEHLDYRAVGAFVARIERQRERGASIWMVGLHPYLRALFQVSGQGPALSRLEWGAGAVDPGFGGRLGRGALAGGEGPSRAEPWDGMVA